MQERVIWDILSSSSESSKIIGSTFALGLAFAGAAFLAGGLTSSPSDMLALAVSLVSTDMLNLP
jgi:hypothetical protein